MIRIGLPGRSGKMRSLVVAEIPNYADCVLADDWQACDVIIDFTLASALPDLIAIAIKNKTPYVCCTTGIDESILRGAAQHIPVLVAPNTSLSLAVAKKAVAQMAKALAPFDYTVHIHEEHHTRKKDAPSGTALALGAVVGQPVTYSSMRAGDIVGEHTVIFASKSETIRLHHSVTDRTVFAHGGIEAALWLTTRPVGFYSMDDMLAF